MKKFTHTVLRLCSVCHPRTNKTVRYAFPLVFSAIALLGAQAINSRTETAIIVEPSSATVRAGESFYLSVYVNAHTPVNAVNLEITLPNSQIDVTGIDTGESVITLWTEEPYVSGNTAYFRGGTFRRGFLGKHLIGVTNAKAVETGIANIEVTDFQLLAGDGSGSEVDVSSNDDLKSKVYIAREDGTFAPGNEPTAVTVTGAVRVFIYTDIDGDGSVTLSDVSRFMASWYAKDTLFDFNNDGRMTFRDFGIILSDSFFR